MAVLARNLNHLDASRLQIFILRRALSGKANFLIYALLEVMKFVFYQPRNWVLDIDLILLMQKKTMSGRLRYTAPPRPRDRKDNVSVRPIRSMIGSAQHQLAEWLYWHVENCS